jgi:hypothetical protein
MRSALLVIVALGIAPVVAKDHAERRPALTAQYVRECGSCHTPFAPRTLPAASWNEIMAGLERHFGTDASIDAATLKAIRAWLEENAAAGKRASSPPPENRITRSDWFVRKHRKIAPATWQKPSIRKSSNCAACHPQADQGSFHEHDVRVAQ